MANLLLLGLELFYLTLCILVNVSNPYQFLESPLNTTAIEGGIAYFPCRVGSTDTSEGPQHSYWQRLKDSHQISENNNVEKYAPLHRSFAERIAVISDAPNEFRLQISNLELEDEGYYVCWHLDENNYSHYSVKGYLNILPRQTDSWFPSCSLTKVSGPDINGLTVGSVVTFNCQAPNELQLPRDVGLYVKNERESATSVPIATCDHVPCSFEYTLNLVDVNSSFICGTQINNETFEEECSITPLRQRQEIYLESVPQTFEVNSSGKFLCRAADDRPNYKYQWFLNDSAISPLQNENHHTIAIISENMNNSVVTCVVSDEQGYIGSKSMRLLVVMATDDSSNDDRLVSAESVTSYLYRSTIAAVDLTESEKTFPKTKDPGVTRPSEAPIVEQSVAIKSLFGIPIEFFIFMSGFILILLLLLIIIVLLLQRQKRQQSNVTMEREKHSGNIEKGDLSVNANSKREVIILKSSVLQYSRPPSSNEPSFYDNVPSNDEMQLPCQQVQLFNALSSKKSNSLETTDHTELQISDDHKHWSVQGTDYTILDPDMVSEDSLDMSVDEVFQQRSPNPRSTPETFGPSISGRSFSVKNQPAQLLKHSHAIRQTSLPVPLNSPSSLYAVTSLISPDDKQIMASPGEKLQEGSGPSTGSSSRHGSQSDYATPNNHPKLKNFTLTESTGESSLSSNDVISNVSSDFLKEHLEDTVHGGDQRRTVPELSASSTEYAEINDPVDMSKSASAHSLNSDCHSTIFVEVTKNSPAAIVKLENVKDGSEKIVILDDSKYIRKYRKSAAPVEDANMDTVENMLEKVL